MAAFARGDLVTVPFPFSGAPGEKIRPAIVLASWTIQRRTDYLLCMVTSQATSNPTAIALSTADATNNSIRVPSFIRPLYMYSADESRIRRKVGVVKLAKVIDALAAIRQVIN